MNTMTSSPKRRPVVSSLIAAVLGGLVVLVIGAVLIETDVIDTGDTTNVVRQAPISQAATDPASSSGGKTVHEIYREDGPGVVYIQAQGVSGGETVFGQAQRGTATGSGFVVDGDGTILTNAHVVEGASKVTVSFEEGGEAIDADIKGVDADSDIAVLKIDPKGQDLTVLPLGDSSRVQVGDPVVAIGNPFGLQRTVTSGIVSALQRQLDAPSGFSISDVIQTDASINPGNSGGPLLDAQGKVIGINSQIATGGGQGSVGIGFAVPIDTAKQELPKLRAGKEIKRAYLGVSMADVTAQVAKQLDLPVDEGALVQTVTKGSPAAKAGLHAGEGGQAGQLAKGGDVILAVDGERVASAGDVVDAVASKQPGDTVELEYYRGQDKRTATVTLGERPEQLSSSG
ncbi:MAG: trypsin-like peptidase domain-containing protein [Thermoleophilaceae bacterium]|nr:trypsin-like peptidase domain-containing protein [Thermoleophilaceae bacterium]